MYKVILKHKLSIAILLFFALTFALSAETLSYSFSGFGGGLPSSATKLSQEAADDDVIIIDDIEESEGTVTKKPAKKTEVPTDVPTEAPKKKNTALIVSASILGAVVLTAAVVAVCTATTKEGSGCTDMLLDTAADSCEDELAGACGDIIEDSCDAALDSACDSLLTGSLALFPIYVP